MGEGNKVFPRNWAEVPIGDICTLLNGRAFKPIEWREKGVPIIRIQNLKDPNAAFNYCDFEVDERFHVKEGDLLFAWSGTPGTSFGAHIWFGSFAYLNQHIFRVVFNEKYIFRDFFKYALNERLSEIISKAQGGVGLRHITKRKFEKVRIVFPPFNEQKRIVAKIEELQGRSCRAREALETIPKLLEQLRQSILAAAFRGDLTRKWREQNPDVEPASELLKRIRIERRKRWEKAELDKLKAKGLTGDKLDAKFAQQRKKYKEPVPVDTSDLPELPEGWCWGNWSEIGFCQNGRAFPSKYYSKEGIRLLRPGNLHVSGKVEWTVKNTRWLPLEWEDRHKDYIIGPRELVINLTAQSLKDEFLGRVCFTDPGERCLLNQRLARLTPVALAPLFCLCLFKSPVFRRYVDTLNTGSLIQHMFTSQIEEFIFPLPPTEEQEVLVQKVKEFQRLKARVEQCVLFSAEQNEILDHSILSKAFRGELVSQDQNDESASILLERIRQEKARQAAEKKAKPKKRGRKKQK